MDRSLWKYNRKSKSAGGEGTSHISHAIKKQDHNTRVAARSLSKDQRVGRDFVVLVVAVHVDKPT